MHGSLQSACTPTDCVNEMSFPLPTLILIIVLCYIYIASLKNCIQPDDGHSSIGRNMYKLYTPDNIVVL